METSNKISTGDASRLFHGAIHEINTKFGGNLDTEIETLITSSLSNSTSGIGAILDKKPELESTLIWTEKQIKSQIAASHNWQESVSITFSVLKQVTDLPKTTGGNWHSRQLGYILYPSQLR